jgi:hypothetical protein
VTATFRDLWLRRQRKARAARFKLAHNRCLAVQQTVEIEWVEIDCSGLTDRIRSEVAEDPLKLELAKRNRLRASKF